MLTKVLLIAAAAAVLIGALIIYGRHSKNQTPMMNGGCHGDCAHCASRCEDEQKK